MEEQNPQVSTKMIPELSVRAEFLPGTINEEKRTVEIVFASETPVKRRTWFDGPIEEILVCSPEAIKLNRLDNGAPLLDNHNRFGSVTNQLGVVVGGSTMIENGRARATVRFSKREVPDEVWKDVKDGIVRNASVGYVVHTYEVTKHDDKPNVYRATEWEPREISLTPVQADEVAGVRSESEDQLYSVTILNRSSMNPHEEKEKGTEKDQKQRSSTPTPQPETKKVPETPASTAATQTRSAEQIVAEALKQERQRTSQIREAVRTAGLDEKFATEMIENGTTIDEARAAIIEKWKENGAPAQRSQSPEATLKGPGEKEKRQTGIIVGLGLRSGDLKEKNVTKEELALARNWRTIRLEDLARECLRHAGESTEGLGRMELVGRAFTSSTGDFPVLLEGTIRRVLLNAYGIQADTWRRFCNIGSVSDFREYKRLRMGTLSRLDKIQENQEYKTKAIPDAEFETIAAETFGNLVNISRKMVINDDLSAFTRIASMMGRAAARSIEIDVYAMFGENSGNGPTMQDGNPLFHASHGNISGAAGVISIAAVEADRVQMSQQKDVSGNDFLDLRPSVLVCPVGLGGTARVVNEAQYDTATNVFQKPNIVNGLYSDIVDTPRLTGTPWYSFCDPSIEPVFEVVFLDGNQTPFMENMNGFTVDGTQYKIRHDYGVGAIGWRGVVKNAGQ
jgi:hypothetical protein